MFREATEETPTALIERAASEASSLTDLTPERVLGLSAREVSRLRGMSFGADGPVLDQAAMSRYRSIGVPLSMAQNAAFVRGQSGGTANTRRAIANALSGLALERQIGLLVEETATPGTAMWSAAGSGWCQILLPAPAYATSQLPIGRRRYKAIASPDTVPGEPLELDGQLLGWLLPDGSGAQLLFHPWLSDSSLTTRDLGQRCELLGQLIDLVLAGPVNVDRFEPDGEMARQRELAAAVSALDMLPAFVELQRENSVNRINTIQAELRSLSAQVGSCRISFLTTARQAHDIAMTIRTLETVETAADPTSLAGRELAALRQRHEAAETASSQWREQLSENLRQVQAKRQDLAQAQAALSSVGAAELSGALVEVMRITENRCVRACRLVSGHTPAIDVTLHPLVIRSSGQNYLFDALRFQLPLDGSSSRPGWQGHASPSPHPHVSTDHSTCWGAAGQPLAEALQRKEYSTVVRLICGWARIYNGQSPYVAITQFPRTPLEPGWHPELPVSV